MMRELVIDSFAGGGGASTGIALALGRAPDIAINHDAEALAMHAANHPATRHLPHNVWKVDPVEICGGLPVGLLWASPDCKHHSKAKGGKPRSRAIRDLAWVVVKWARQVRPRVILLENVEEFRHWGPIDAAGIPCPERKGATFDAWVGELKRLGYRVQWRELRACDYGAPTIRRRLFLVARRDGLPIVWPAPTHGAPTSAGVLAGTLKPWRTAAEIIDWSLPCHSIFLTREEGRAAGVNRPLADATMARIAKGVKRYVLDAARPFIVPLTHQGGERGHALDEPSRTVTGAHRGEQALVTPFVAGCGGRAGQSPPKAVDEPSNTVTAKADQVLVTPFVAGLAHGDSGGRRAYDITEPLTTVQAGGKNQALIAPFVAYAQQGGAVRDADGPLHTVTASTKDCNTVVQPFLQAYYGAGSGGDDRSAAVDEPVRTIVTENRHAIVAPLITKFRPGSAGASIDDPLATVTSNSFLVRPGGAAPLGLVAAHLSRQFGASVGSDADEPIGTVTAGGGGKTALITAGLCVKNNHGDKPMYGLDEPTHTVVAGGTHHAVVAAHLSTMRNSDKPFQGADEPAHTVTAGGARTAIVAAFLAQHNGATTPNPGRPADEPLSTLTVSGSHQAIVEASLLSHSYGSNTAGGAGDPAEPLKTVTAGGFHAAEVRAFLVKYYGEGSVDQAAGDPLHTVPTRDRFGLVTTTIDGEPYAVVDIGMRMLSPRELFRAQGFPDSYVIDRGVGPDGNAVALTKTAQVRMCGNSVCPPMAEALVRANYAEDQVSASPTPRRRRLELLPDLFRLQAAE